MSYFVTVWPELGRHSRWSVSHRADSAQVVLCRNGVPQGWLTVGAVACRRVNLPAWVAAVIDPVENPLDGPP